MYSFSPRRGTQGIDVTDALAQATLRERTDGKDNALPRSWITGYQRRKGLRPKRKVHGGEVFEEEGECRAILRTGLGVDRAGGGANTKSTTTLLAARCVQNPTDPDLEETLGKSRTGFATLTKGHSRVPEGSQHLECARTQAPTSPLQGAHGTP